MVEKEGQKMDKVSVMCTTVSPPSTPGTGLSAEHNKRPSKPTLKPGHYFDAQRAYVTHANKGGGSRNV